jgi:hypothetical protein
MKDVKKRIKNPLFLLAVAGLVYQGLPHIGVNLELGTFQTIVDVITYAAIGTGIYSTFNHKEGEEK